MVSILVEPPKKGGLDNLAKLLVYNLYIYFGEDCVIMPDSFRANVINQLKHFLLKQVEGASTHGICSAKPFLQIHKIPFFILTQYIAF